MVAQLKLIAKEIVLKLHLKQKGRALTEIFFEVIFSKIKHSNPCKKSMSVILEGPNPLWCTSICRFLHVINIWCVATPRYIAPSGCNQLFTPLSFRQIFKTRFIHNCYFINKNMKKEGICPRSCFKQHQIFFSSFQSEKKSILLFSRFSADELCCWKVCALFLSATSLLRSANGFG